MSLEVWVEGLHGVCIEQCVHTGKCVYMYICRCFVGSPLLQFHLLSLFSAHSVIDGERNAMFILIFDMYHKYHNQDNQVQLDNLNTQPTIYSMSCTTNNQLLAPEGLVVFITEAQDTIEAATQQV